MNRSGQALTEFLIGISLFLAVFSFSVWLFTHERRRLICEKDLFEATRAELNRPDDEKSDSKSTSNDRTPAVSFGGGVRTRRTDKSVIGTLRCGAEEMRVELKKLEDWE